MPEPDPYPLAEERRLFYVALTRARRQVRIYTLADAPSRFLIELARTGAVEIEAEEGVLSPCPKCGCGNMKRSDGQSEDRKHDGSGKSGAVGVDIGGRRLLKKKTRLSHS